MQPTRDPGPDPVAARQALANALALPALAEFEGSGAPSAEASAAAYELARALGYCRLFGVKPGDALDRTLPPPMARAGGVALVERLAGWTADARNLGSRWDETEDPAEAESLCADLLEARMDAWAAWAAIDEAHGDLQEEGGDDPDLVATVDRALDALEAFDATLLAHVDLLATVCDTPLLENWRELLAPAFRDPWPWWLDGRLEAAARRSVAKFAATLPGPEVWARIRAAAIRGAGHPTAQLPPLDAGTGVLAAARTPERGPLPGGELAWASPDGRFRAELILPECSSDAEEVRPRPLSFTRMEDEAPAEELVGQPVRVGLIITAVGAGARAVVTLAGLRAGETIDLRVGEPPDLWWRLPGEADRR